MIMMVIIKIIMIIIINMKIIMIIIINMKIIMIIISKENRLVPLFLSFFKLSGRLLRF